MMSGSALSHIGLSRQPETIFRQFALAAGAPNALTESTSRITTLLGEKTYQELVRIQFMFAQQFLFLQPFRPVVEKNWEGAFITKDPEQIWKSGAYEQRQFLTGVTGYEEGLIGALAYNETIAAGLLANLPWFIVRLLEVPGAAVEPILQYYFDGKPTLENFENILKVG